MAFLLTLTDDRVRNEKAPFDHPQLCVADGEVTPILVTSSGTFSNEAMDNMVEIPEVGAGGKVGAGGSLVPLQTFAELIGAVPTSGERAHDLTKACTIH